MVTRFTVAGGRIVEIEAIAEPERLRQIDIAVLSDWIWPHPGAARVYFLAGGL